METSDNKSSGPQQLDTMPSRKWGLDRLRHYAQEQHQGLLDAEKAMAPNYWRLGMALTLIREDFHHGQWKQYLASVEIDPTRASKAQAIYRTFLSVAALGGLSVAEAYALRSRRKKYQTKKRTRTRHERVSMRSFLGRVMQEIDIRIDEATAVSPPTARKLLQAVADTKAHLDKLETRLQQRANVSVVERRRAGPVKLASLAT